MIRKGADWGSPAGEGGPVETITVTGDDAALAAAVRAHPGATFALGPGCPSDLARSLGLSTGTVTRVVLPCDALHLDDGTLAVNAVVLGVAPDHVRAWHRAAPVEVTVDGRTVVSASSDATRATTVVVATGQYLRGADVVPRGHPGDGRVEVQIYALRPGERRGMRERLPSGAHVPHPRIVERSGRVVSVRWTGGRAARDGAPLEVDGHRRGRVRSLRLEVAAGAVRVLG